ncbi:Uncharacterised protein [Enterococcus casseliflavus]|uniref:hypothetical protein n=1 Tax=Enterococcus casseliflavus TaxID=37734 RepID=UPI000E05E969|nr:hypothetical protein [Enterococcus casseliflavus]GEB30168.1 hypothetical protein ECA02_32630 [Enterococcus casseliflavus]STP33079.1 Uncharacterised protein [Enterococcus casseliflavus]
MFVMIENGYINSWSLLPADNHEEIEPNHELFGLLDCVKVIDGKAVLDEQKQKELIDANQIPSDVDQLFYLLAQSTYQQMMQAQEMQSLQQQLAEITYAFMIAQGGNQNEISE